MNSSVIRFRPLLLVLALLSGGLVRAQWQTQTVTLKPGWNAVFLHVDASYATMDSLLLTNTPNIAEVWRWSPATSTAQFQTSPQQSTVPNSQWLVWDRTAAAHTLAQLSGNAAYLVRMSATTPYVWQITGRPLAPRYQWSTDGLNFIGFPTPAAIAPNFSNFLKPVGTFLTTAQVYYYPGGDLNPDTNPVRVYPPLFSTTAVTRGAAYWIRSTLEGYYNRYYGPVDVVVPSDAGIDFSNSRSTASIRLQNTTDQNQIINLSLLASAPIPSGQTAIAGTPPLLVRGPRSSVDLSFTHTLLTLGQNPTNHAFSLTPKGTPGSDVEVVLGLNRTAMAGSPGQTFAGILRFADSGGLSQIEFGVVAQVADTTGLWVGNATISQVGQYLVTYPKDGNGKPILGTNTLGGTPYVASATNTSMTDVARSVPLRLIVHNDGSQKARLIQRVYYGLDVAKTPILGTQESLLDSANLNSARRISAVHLPFSHANAPWLGTGTLGIGNNVSFIVQLGANEHASNPFLHTFHPDHDNLDPTFKQQNLRGVESYDVTRQINLQPTAPGTNFAGLTASSSTLTGTYSETMTFLGLGSNRRDLSLQGTFSLTRIATIPTLSLPPP